MYIFKELVFILAFYLLGEGISLVLPFSFPGSIIGMLVLFATLILGWIRLEDIQNISRFFLKYMPLFFIPAGVSVMASYDLIAASIIPIIFTLVLSTLFVLAATALLVEYFVTKAEDE